MNKTNYILGSQTKVPPQVVTWAESLKTEAGVFVTSYKGQNIYLICAGQKPSGGYGIVVSSSPANASALEYRVERPKQDEFVIQIITYPYELVLSSDTLQFIKVEKGRKQLVPAESRPLS